MADPIPVKGIILLEPLFVFLLLNLPVTFLIHLVINRSRQNPLNRKILIAGAGKVGKALLEYYERHPYLGTVIGFLDNQREGSGNVLILGTFDDFERIAEERHVHELIITTRLNDEETIQKMIKKAEHSGVRPSVVANYYTMFRRNFELEI